MSGCGTFSSPRYAGPITDHFDGERFHNQVPAQQRELGDLLRWWSTRKPGPWADWTDAPPGPAPPKRVGPDALRVTFVNHSTVLIQVDGLNILTDPIWSMRAGPLSWIGPKRRRPPGIRFEDLPPIDVVLISHNHYDHLDIPTIERLVKRDHPRILTGLGNGAVLEAEGMQGATELDWWEVEPVGGDVLVTAVPAQHFSMRGLMDHDGTLWAGFVIESHGGPIYFAGDTAWGPHFAQIRDEFGPMRLALLPIGAFEPRWIMAPVHISPEEAVHAHHVLGAAMSVAIHFGTFAQADDGQEGPIIHLAQAPAPPEFRVLGFGEGADVPPLKK
ncbi:MAG: MBL fold metallo-hydrolase [Deltaproteobacteria bacterium]|nr:MBL fold metallo-hydrolase [Deltaproteobacteria bacterium]